MRDDIATDLKKKFFINVVSFIKITGRQGLKGYVPSGLIVDVKALVVNTEECYIGFETVISNIFLLIAWADTANKKTIARVRFN